MKNVLYILMLCLAFASCQSSKLKSAAQKQMEATLKEFAKDPSSLKLSNIEVVYSDDSLCIIHADCTSKNGLGNEITSQIEYVMLSQDDKNYEACQQISSSEEAIYQPKETFEKNKKGQIYEKLSYESALYYLATIFVNTQGREAGIKDGFGTAKIPVPTETGCWQIRTFRDEFGEKTNNYFLFLQGSGTFSNSATTNSRILAAIYATGNDDVSIQIAEYGSYLVKTSDTYDVRVKDDKGTVYSMTMNGDIQSGYITPSYDSKETMTHLLNSNGPLIFSIQERTSYGTPSTYIFKIDVTGYEKAKTFCMALKMQAYADDPYFKENKAYVEKVAKDPAYKKAGGVYYKVIKQGNGQIPTKSSTIKMHYEGRNVYGKVFDNSYQHMGYPTEMPVSAMIPGFIDALTHMPVGSIWEVVMPSELAYGDRQVSDDLKPFSTLIFKIELVSCTN